ncbi:MAG: wax ester/triacylglycerol synthase family O-acyltransferase [Parahaliea sp.]
MSKLSAIDALFLSLESRELPAHIAGLQIFQLPKGKGAPWLQSLLQEMRERQPGFPFNQRLVPSMLGTPTLVEDKDFEIDYHVRHNVLPKPGTQAQLAAAVARMHSNLLDRDRPLWEFHLIEGLEGRRFAFYIKIHHALCDGATFTKWMSESTDPKAGSKLKAIWERNSRASTASTPIVDSLQSPISLLRKSAQLSLGLGRYATQIIKQRLIEGDNRVALPLSGAHTALNAPLTASRNLAFTEFPLDELKAMGRTVNGTLNDVVLTICDAALRRYLGEQGQEPNEPMVAAVPVNLRKKDAVVDEGNMVSSLQVKLGEPNQSPAERLRMVSESVKMAKELCQDIPAAATQVVGFGSALLGAVGSALRLEGIMPPPLNLVISNVPGPTNTRYFSGAKLLATYPVSGIAPMTVLNVTVYSYNKVLYVGLVSGRRALPHLRDLRLCMDEIYQEYKAALLP